MGDLSDTVNVLLLAPQPFYQERGTPIAVRHLVEALCSHGYRVDLLTYHVGADIELDGLRIIRIRRVPFVREIPIGFSWQKILCDVFLAIEAMRLVRSGQYDVVHAVEESVFIGMGVRRVGRGRPKLVYDLDSLLSSQLAARSRFFRSTRPLLESFEAMAMRDCDLALPMCQALSDRVQHVAPGKPCFVVEDFALSAPQTPATTEDLKAHWKTRPDKLVLYAGNLAHYQGIDLLLRALQVLDAPTVGLAIVGGKGNEIQTWSDRAEALGVAARVRFLGARPLVQLSTLLQQADILVSPRIEGENTPMKIYGYLASGRPVVATDIRAHSQVLDESCALLTRIQPEALADALRQLLDDPGRCHQLGLRGIERIAQCEFTREAFEARLLAAYSRLRDSKPAC